MVVAYNREVTAVINTDNLLFNIQQIKSNCITTQHIFAVVKADAYGHGLEEVSKVVESAVDGFCVALIDEAIALRNAGITKPILVMGLTPAYLVPLCVANDVSVTFTNLEFLQEVVSLPLTKSLKVHLAVDTGMNRIGVETVEETLAIEHFLQQHDLVFEFEGIFTHFATADGEDDNKVVKQYERFERIVDALSKKPKYVHLGNSAMTLWRHQFYSDIARIGIAMYGLNPSDFVLDLPFELKSALSLTAQINHVHLLKKGESVSYGAKYIAKKDEWIATVPIGYADGWRREYAGMGVYLNGMKCDVLGVICMDQLMIRVPQGTQVGETVELIGKYQSASDVAVSVGTIGYEVLCGISPRVNRQYVSDML